MRTRLHLWLGSMLVALLAFLVPSAAHAQDGDLVAVVNDGTVQGSCTFSVRSLFEGKDHNTYVRAKLTTKGAEIKPSFFATRKVASISVSCEVLDALDVDNFFGATTTRNASTVYQTRYITLRHATSYKLCTKIAYTLRNGMSASPARVCSE